MKRIITKELTRYAGDHDHILYLDLSVEQSNMQLCISHDGGAIVLHLTSDVDYMNWLSEHHKSLLLIPEDKWFHHDAPDYYPEFHYTLKKLIKLIEGE